MAATALQIDALWAGLNDPDTGQSYSGAIVGFFEAGTTTPKAVWLDSAKTLPTPSGVTQTTLDSNGVAKVYADGKYKINIYAPEDTGLTTPLSGSIDNVEYIVTVDDGTEGVDSIADLRAGTGGAEDGYAITLLGYYTPGDGGGGQFYWDSTSTETDNSVTIIKVTSITIGRWKRLIVNGKIDLAQAGVIDDNAATDQQAIIQSVIDLGFREISMIETTTSGGAGIGSPLVMPASGGVNIVGTMNGGLSIISAISGFTGGVDNEMVQMPNGADFCEFRHLTLSAENNAKHAFYSAGANNNNVFEDISISKTTGVAISGQYWMTRFTNIRVSTVAGGFDINGVGNTTLNLKNCYVINSSTTAFKIADSQGLLMHSCAADCSIDQDDNIYNIDLNGVSGEIIGFFSEGSSGADTRPRGILNVSGGNNYVRMSGYKQQYGGGDAAVSTSALINFSGSGILTLENNYLNNLENYTNIIATSATAGTLELRNNFYKDVGGSFTQGLLKGTNSINSNTIVKDFDFISNASAGTNASQSVPTGTDTTIISDGEIYDLDGDYDNATGIFTCPTDGVYEYYTELIGNNLAAASKIQLKTVTASGTFTREDFNDSGGVRDVTVQFFDSRKFSKGDTIYIQSWHNNGSNLNIDGKIIVKKLY